MNDVITSRTLYGQPDRLETIELTPLGPTDPVPTYPLVPDPGNPVVQVDPSDESLLGRAKNGVAYLISQFKPGYPLHETALEVMKALQELEASLKLGGSANAQPKRSHHKKVT